MTGDLVRPKSEYHRVLYNSILLYFPYTFIILLYINMYLIITKKIVDFIILGWIIKWNTRKHVDALRVVNFETPRNNSYSALGYIDSFHRNIADFSFRHF